MYLYENWCDANLRVASKNGSEARVWCFNPSHDDNNPSCDFNMEKGCWLCWSCGFSGSVNEDFNDIDVTAQLVRQRFNKSVEDVVEDTVEPVPESLLNRYKTKTDYWDSRNISRETQELFELGFDTALNAATIPVRDDNGNLYGVTKRFIDPDYVGSRYKYPYGFKKSQHVFASWLSDEYNFDTVCVTEGSIDAMRIWDNGLPGVAIYGSTVSSQQLEILLRTGTRKVIYFGDGDAAGLRAKLRTHGYWIRTDGSYQYKLQTDFSRQFALYHVPNHFGKKDAGEMTDNQIKTAIQSAELYRPKVSTKYQTPVVRRNARKRVNDMLNRV